MANEEHLAILAQGVEVWNRWREENPEVRPYLAKAILRVANLGDANFRSANLSDTNFRGANLIGANLISANLINADLVFANLRSASLRGANLRGANLIDADLRGADCGDADLHDADFGDAILRGVDLRSANLRGVDLRGADLIGAILIRANLDGVDLKEASFGFTSVSGIDLSQTEGLESVKHYGSSHVSTDTLVTTLRNSGDQFTDEQIVFFEGAGVSSVLLEYLPSMMESNPIQFYSCFISYSTGDEAFAEKVNGDLSKSHITTWKWNLNAVAGRDLNANIDGAIRHYDKMILLCSVDSLNSPEVKDEIIRAIDKEKRQERAKAQRIKEARESGGTPPADIDTDVLVPIALDRYVFDEWESPLAVQVKRKFIPDFTKANQSDKAYKDALDSLIHALSPNAWPIKGNFTLPTN